MKFYTGIGSRETPDEVLGVMEDAAYRLAALGYKLRSGKAKKADEYFQKGVQRFCSGKILDKESNVKYAASSMKIDSLAEIYIPWSSFKTPGLWDEWDIPLDMLDYLVPGQTYLREELVKSVHPNFEALKNKRAAFLLHQRNVHQILGGNILSPVPSRFCLFYAKTDNKGEPVGGTATAVKLAKAYGVKTLNLNSEENIAKLQKFLITMEEKHNGVEIPKQTE